MKIIELTPQNYSKEQIINTYKAFSMELITQLLFNILPFFPVFRKLSYKHGLYKKLFQTPHTWDVAEETDGDGDAGGVSRLQGRFSVT